MDTDSFAKELNKVRQRITILAKRNEDSPQSQQEIIDQAFEELQTALEELHVAEEELTQQNEELMLTRINLESEHQRYQELFEFAPDGYLVTSIDGVILEANRTAADMLAVAQRFIIRKPLINFIAETERKDFRLLLNQFAQSNQKFPHKIELRIHPRAGKPFDAGLTIAPIHNATGNVEAMRWMMRDITERKLAEENIIRLNTELEQKVIDRTSRLESANRLKDELLVSEQDARHEAEAANRSKDEFLAMVSHELRTPLNAMMGWIHILRTPSSSEPHRTQALDVIERNAKSQSQIIDDILEVSRIITGKFRLNRQLIDLAPVIHAAIDSVRHIAESKRIEIHSDIEADIEQVSGDSTRLQQVVWNLISNAIKFTPQGGHIGVKLERADNEARITISDTGKGITSEFMPFIFDRFRQADASTTRQYSGLGLGLAIVRHLVEMHGGRVEATSDGENKGSIFTVYLPVTIKTQQSFEYPIESVDDDWPTISVNQPDLSGIWIVEIDDEADARELLAVVLEQWGARVSSSGSCDEVVRLIEGESDGVRPDVLIADIAMPGQDGFSLIRKIRSLPQDKGGAIPAIALTAYAGDDDRSKVLSAGFQMHLAKPVSLVKLGAVVKRLATGNGTVFDPNQPSRA
ncbi:MAG: ATP-binding protein, partial [Blastocatellia bacterium]